MTENTAGSVPADAGEPITVNVALAIRIIPERWSTTPESDEDLLTRKIRAEKGVSEEKARELASMMLEAGLGDMVISRSNGANANAVRREIREHVLSLVAGDAAYQNAGATVELNEARRTNHKPKEK